MNKVRTNFLFWAISSLAIVPFIILAFFAHPGKEDYLFNDVYKQLGFWEGQKDLYQQWNGRFFINALESVCVKMNFISDYYFLLPLLLFAFTYMAAVFLIHTVNKLLLQNYLSASQFFQAGFFLLLLNVYLLGDIASNFYWFSGAIVYQTPIILLLLLISLLVKRFAVHRTKKMAMDIFIAALVILLIGCNETFATITIAILFFAAVFSVKFHFTEKRVIVLYFLIAFATGILVLSTSGIFNRQQRMHSNTRYITVLPIIAFRVYTVFYNLFKEPLLWLSAAACFIAGSCFPLTTQAEKALLYFKSPKKFYHSLILILLLLLTILTPLLLIAKGSFPDRALNNIIFVTAIILLALVFIYAHVIFQGKFEIIHEKIKSKSVIVVTGAAMLLSATYTEAWKSVFSGYFYHAILIERDHQFSQAQKNNQKTITIQSYDAVLQQKILAAFPRGGFKSATALLLQPPTVIPFFNEAEEDQPGYRMHYGITSIIIQKDKP